MLEEERRRREVAEKRLQEETVHRQQLIEKEVKMRAKNFSQVRSRSSLLCREFSGILLGLTSCALNYN